MDLPEEDPVTVECLMQWLYFKSSGLIKAVCSETSNERYWQLARLNTLADKFDVRLLNNAIIDDLFTLNVASEAVPPQLPVIAYIYENTTEKSSLRELMVGWYVWHIDEGWYTWRDTRALLAEIPMFAADLAIAMSRKAQDSSLKSPFESKPSSYYQDPPKNSGD